MRCLSAIVRRSVLIVAIAFCSYGLANAQSGRTLTETTLPSLPTTTIPASEPSAAPVPRPHRIAKPIVPEAETAPLTTAPATAASPAASATQAVELPKPHTWIPYTVRSGDTLGTISAIFGVTVDDLARANRMHPEDELNIGDELRVPNPFLAQVNGLKAQVDTLYAQGQSEFQKSQQAETKVRELQEKIDDLNAQNQSLSSDVRVLPWWKTFGVTLAFGSVLMFGVMVVTLFEWWRMRRKFVALVELTESLRRLDYKYKAMVAKAELRLQQLYGRRRQGLADGQPRPKLSEEVEIERMSEELKEILEHHLVRLGVRPDSSGRRGRWRELLGSMGGESSVETRSPRSVRR